MTNVDSVLKSRYITFPVVMYGCESWILRKAERQRMDAFKLWWWKRPLRIPWSAKRSNQSILKEIKPEYSLEGLILKLQFFSHLIWRTNSLEKTLMLWKIDSRMRRGHQMVGRHYWFNGHEFEQTQVDSKGQRRLVCYGPWGHKELDTI